MERPDITSEEWTPWVLSQMAEDEQFKGLPKVDGLRRLLTKLGYEVFQSSCNVIQSPNPINEYIATVEFYIIYTPPGSEIQKVCRDVADAQKCYLGKGFDQHVTAIAATRAEGRTIRKLLQLKNVITLEEKMAGDQKTDEERDDDSRSAEPSQIALIRRMCVNRKLDADKVTLAIVEKKLGACRFGDCQTVIQEMNNKKSKFDLKDCGE